MYTEYILLAQTGDEQSKGHIIDLLGNIQWPDPEYLGLLGRHMGQENQVIDISLYKRKIDMIALLQGIEGLYSADTLSGFKRIVPLAILDGSEMVPLIHKTHNSLRYAECSYFGRVHKQNGW